MAKAVLKKILRLKKEAIETKCFPLTVKANLAAAAAKAKLAAARATQPSGAEKQKVPEKKKGGDVSGFSGLHYHMKAGLFPGVDEIPEDKLAKESQLFCDGYRARVLLAEKLWVCQQVLLDQYNTFGYAYDAKVVTDDEDEDEVEVAVKN